MWISSRGERLRGQNELESSLNYPRSDTLSKYQPSLKRPTYWMVHGENQRGTPWPVDPYFRRKSAGTILSFFLGSSIGGLPSRVKLPVARAQAAVHSRPRASSWGSLHWHAQWVERWQPEINEDISVNAPCCCSVLTVLPWAVSEDEKDPTRKTS